MPKHKPRQFQKTNRYLGTHTNHDTELFGNEQPYRLLIHNLPGSTDPSHFQAFLREKLGDIQFTAFQLFETFAWITVENRDLCNKAYTILHNASYLSNTLILLKDKLSDQDMNSKYGWKVRVAEKRGSTLFTGRTRKVFVGNLPYNINAGEVRSFFQKRCGAIDDFRMSRGCCFIRFKEAKPSVHLALDCGGQEVFGRKIRVEEELDDSDRPDQRLREKKRKEKVAQQERDAAEESARRNEQNDNKVDAPEKVTTSADAEESTQNNEHDDANDEDDTIEVTETINNRKGPKFLSAEEIKKRDFLFEPTEALFTKKKRRSKLQKKIETAQSEETRVEYVNHEGQKSFVHQKKKNVTVEELDDMTAEELFVPQAPEKIVRKKDAAKEPKEEKASQKSKATHQKTETKKDTKKPAPSTKPMDTTNDDEDISFPAFNAQSQKKRKRDADSDDTEQLSKKERKKRRKEERNAAKKNANQRFTEEKPQREHRTNKSSRDSAPMHNARAAWGGATNLYDGEGPTDYERKHNIAPRAPKPPHPNDIVFKDPPKKFNWTNK